MYRIKELSQKTRVTSQTIRYYEQRGILPAPARAENGYRAYTDDDVERLNFVRRARQLGFSLENIGEILTIRDKLIPPCDYVLDLIEDRIAEVQTRIHELELLRDELIALRDTEQRVTQASTTECICPILEIRPNQ
ncbi:heavy metal-responsive transcriptional regulator [Patescibacteria group bacterium]|nr:heavy metal-responsive transcriptional regulator [Patescibacteria group bacterium]